MKIFASMQVGFELFPEGGNKCCAMYIIRKIIPNLWSIKSKNMSKVFD